MCDPISLSIASTVVGVAGSAATAMGQMSAQKKQQNAVDSWQIKQKQFRDQEKVRQEGLRQQADAARLAGVDQMGADAQDKRQTEEAARLEQYFTGDDPNATPAEAEAAATSVADAAMLSGQELAPGSFQTDLAKKIAESTAEAKERMGALARVSSYGGTQGGLATVNPMIQAESGQQIDMANEMRKGSLGAFGIEKSIEPLAVSYTPSPLADVFSNALALGSYGAGSAAGKLGAGTTAGAVDSGIGMWGNSLFPAKPKAPKGALQTAGLPW